MVGKFVLIALLGFSLTQVQGNELENAIKNALNKVKGLYQDRQKKIEAILKEVDSKDKLIESRTANLIMKFEDSQGRIQQALRNIAQDVEQSAKEANKPASVFQCIEKNEDNANNQIKILINKFKIDMEHLEKVKVDDLKSDTKPLYEKQTTLTVRLERAVKIIENCQNSVCVNTAIRTCVKWLDQLYADIKRILQEVSTVSGNFEREANNYFTNGNRQISTIQSSTMRNIRNCVFRRDDYSEEY